MPYRPSGEIGPLSCRGCRGPPCLRGCLGLRPEASKTSLSFFSILKDSNKLTAVFMLWVALPGLETGKHLSCQHQFPPKTPGGLFCLCLQNDARLHLTRPCDDTVILARAPDHILAVAQLRVRLQETQRPSAFMGSRFAV